MSGRRKKHEVLDRSSRIKEVLRGIARRDTWTEIEQVDCLLFCHDVDRGFEENGVLSSILIDPVGDSLEWAGYKVSTIAHPWSRLVGDKSYRSPKSCNRGIFRSRLSERIKRLLRPSGIGTTSSASEGFWTRMLGDSGARSILLIGCPPELCRAANRLGLPVIELLHGFGYRSLPWGYEARPRDSLPSHFVAFDDVSFETFVKSFGNNCVFRSIRPDSLPSTSHALTRAIFEPPRYRKEALVTLGWQNHEGGRFVDFAPTEVVPTRVRMAIEGGDTRVRWYLRPHPVMMRSPSYSRHMRHLRSFVESNSTCATIEESTIELAQLLREVDCHITMFSEATYEAAFAGVPSLLLSRSLDPGGELHGNFSDLIHEGLAEIASDIHAHELVKWILNCSPRTTKSADSSTLHSIDDVIQKILHQHSIYPK